MRGFYAFEHYRKLRGRIVERGLLHGDVAEAIGRKETYFSNRMRGLFSWTTDDIRLICEFLEIPLEQWTEYFIDGEELSENGKELVAKGRERLLSLRGTGRVQRPVGQAPHLRRCVAEEE